MALAENDRLAPFAQAAAGAVSQVVSDLLQPFGFGACLAFEGGHLQRGNTRLPTPGGGPPGGRGRRLRARSGTRGFRPWPPAGSGGSGRSGTDEIETFVAQVAELLAKTRQDEGLLAGDAHGEGGLAVAETVADPVELGVEFELEARVVGIVVAGAADLQDDAAVALLGQAQNASRSSTRSATWGAPGPWQLSQPTASRLGSPSGQPLGWPKPVVWHA